MEGADGGVMSALVLTETGRTECIFVLFNGADAKEEGIGKKNGGAVLFDLIARCCCFGRVSFTPVIFML